MLPQQLPVYKELLHHYILQNKRRLKCVQRTVTTNSLFIGLARLFDCDHIVACVYFTAVCLYYCLISMITSFDSLHLKKPSRCVIKNLSDVKS